MILHWFLAVFHTALTSKDAPVTKQGNGKHKSQYQSKLDKDQKYFRSKLTWSKQNSVYISKVKLVLALLER